MPREAFDPIHHGTSPAGVEWVTYPKPRETPENFARRAMIAAHRLEELKRRHAAQVVTVRLTPAQAAHVDDELSRCTESIEVRDVTMTARSVTGSRAALAYIAEGMEATRLDLAEAFEEHLCQIESDCSDAQADARASFGARSSTACVRRAIDALERAAGGA